MAVAARYVARELMSVFVVVMVILFTVTVGARFIGYLQDAALGKFSAASVLTILWLRLPGFLELVLPFSLFLALLITLGRLYAEQEFAALQVGGASPSRVLVWLSVPILAVALIVGYFSMLLKPANILALSEFMLLERSSQEFRAVTPGVFHDFQRGKRVTYAESLSADRQLLEEVFLVEYSREDPRVVTLRAEEGRQYVDPNTGTRYLLMKNGTRQRGVIGTSDYQVLDFRELSQRLVPEEAVLTAVDMEARPTLELIERRSEPEVAAELHWRIALPVLVLVTSLLGVGLARVKPRQGRFARLLPGFSVFVGYYVLLVLNQNALLEGWWPPAGGFWPVHLGFLLLGLFMLQRSALPARH